MVALTLFLMLFGGLPLLLNMSIRAQQVSLGVSPPLLEMHIKPGKSVLIAYTLENRGDPVVLKSYVLPFEAKDSNGNIRIKPTFEGPIRFSLDNSLMKLNQPYVLKTNDSQQLLLRIRVPEGAPEGDYYYTLLSETQAPPVTEGITSGRAKASIGSNILVTVTGTGVVDIKGAVSLFDVIPRFRFSFGGKIYNIVDSSDQVPVVMVLANKGRNFMKPQGNITMHGALGAKAVHTIIPQNILAQSERRITATPSATLDCNDQCNEQRPSLVLSGFFLGRYTLSADINFGENSPKIFATTAFIGLPLKFGTVGIVVLLITLTLVRMLKKSESDEYVE